MYNKNFNRQFLKAQTMILTVFVTIMLIACGGNKKDGVSNNSNQSGGNTYGENGSQSEQQQMNNGDYVLFDRVRIEDNVGFQDPVEAFSLLMPNGWKSEGEIQWVAPGQTCAGNNMRFKSVSPDGKYSFEIFPSVTWSYFTNQQMLAFHQSQPQGDNCYLAEPMDARQYLTEVFAPRFLSNPRIISIENNPVAATIFTESNNKARQELMSYGASNVQFKGTGVTGNVQWNDGSEGLVMIIINNAEVSMQDMYTGAFNTNYMSTAQQRVVFKYPAGEKEKAEQMFSVILSSYRTNPAWKNSVDGFWRSVRANNQQIHIGKLKAMDAQTREMGRQAIAKGQQRLNDMDNQMRNWEAKQQSQDKMHTQFVKAIRGVETYQDANGTVELNSGYNHAWSRGDGSSYIMTDNPNFNPSSVFQDQSWNEMKRVD
jgi:hypothetical protein